MQRFRFRLQTLLEVRRRKEKGIKLELASAGQRVASLQELLNSLAEELKDFQEKQKAQREHETDVNVLKYSVAYRHKLKIDMINGGQQLAEFQKEEERVRKELVNAKKETRALELLRERRYEEWRKEYRAEEQDITNDVAQQTYIRKMRAEANREPAV